VKSVKSYKVRYEQDETGWWVATVAAIPGCHTQGKTIEQAEERIREALSLFVPSRTAAAAKLSRDVVLPVAVKKALAESSAKRAKAEALAKQAQDAAQHAARSLVDRGLSLRDVGEMMGVSRQRAHQLVKMSIEKRPARTAREIFGLDDAERRDRRLRKPRASVRQTKLESA
jgi:predicted RNase H-like HicB family nuclease